MPEVTPQWDYVAVSNLNRLSGARQFALPSTRSLVPPRAQSPTECHPNAGILEESLPCFVPLESNVGSTEHARSKKSSGASYPARSDGSNECTGSGSESEGTRNVVSPASPNGSRLVARIFQLWRSEKQFFASCAQASKQMFAVIKH